MEVTFESELFTKWSKRVPSQIMWLTSDIKKSFPFFNTTQRSANIFSFQLVGFVRKYFFSNLNFMSILQNKKKMNQHKFLPKQPRSRSSLMRHLKLRMWWNNEVWLVDTIHTKRRRNVKVDIHSSLNLCKILEKCVLSNSSA